MIVSYWEPSLQLIQTVGSSDQVAAALQPQLESVPTNGLFGDIVQLAKEALKFVLLMVLVPLTVLAMIVAGRHAGRLRELAPGYGAAMC